jgi:hypothetical protein
VKCYFPFQSSSQLKGQLVPYESIGEKLQIFALVSELGSGLIDYIQKMTMAAMQIADMKVWAHRS